MKEITLREVKRWQDEGLDEIDLVRTTVELYGRIVITVCIGSELINTRVPVELDDGTMTTTTLQNGIDLCYQFTLTRGRFLIN